jgi:hypothetical protein
MNEKQLTVLTGSSAAHVGRVLACLSEEQIDIRAHCLVDNGDGNCKLRMVVSAPEKAMTALQRHHIVAVINDVVTIETDDRPGGLRRIIQMLEQHDIRIDYSYTAASQKPGRAIMVFRFSDNALALRILER